jgi:ectoine hydroxylase-related dioxygenase (phytanoyl-CoA dioxygenase family)
MPHRSSAQPGVDDLDALKKDGCCVLRSVLGKDELSAAAKASTAGETEQRAGTVWTRALDPASPPLATFARNPRVLAAVGRLLGTEAPVLTGLTVRNPIGPSAQQALHVDWAGPVEPGVHHQCQALLLLDPMDESNGATRVVPGSHLSRETPGRRFSDPAARHPRQRLLTAQPGDVVIFSSHVWHSGTGNSSGRPRRAVTAAYRSE